MQKIKRRTVCAIEAEVYYRKLLTAQFHTTGDELPILLDTSAESDNAGDQIIMECCLKELPDEFRRTKLVRVPTHRFATENEKEELKRLVARYCVVLIFFQEKCEIMDYGKLVLI